MTEAELPENTQSSTESKDGEKASIDDPSFRVPLEESKYESTNEFKAPTPKDPQKPPSEANLAQILEVALQDLTEKRIALEGELADLSERKSQIEKEFKTSFSGQSDAIARRVKGFQDYLTGALQDLAQSAEQLELISQPVMLSPSPLDKSQEAISNQPVETSTAIAETFKPDEELIRTCLEQFRKEPDFLC